LICKLLVEKNGIRAIERITEIHRDTISDVVKDIARQWSVPFADVRNVEEMWEEPTGKFSSFNLRYK